MGKEKELGRMRSNVTVNDSRAIQRLMNDFCRTENEKNIWFNESLGELPTSIRLRKNYKTCFKTLINDERSAVEWKSARLLEGSESNNPMTRLEAVNMKSPKKKEVWKSWENAPHLSPTPHFSKKENNCSKSLYKGINYAFRCIIDYTRLSSMHGLRYIGDTSLHHFERIFWTVAFLLAIGGSSYFISNLFFKYNDAPVIMSISPSASTIRDIPFPTITICNTNNMRKQQAILVKEWYDITKGKDNLTGELAMDYKLIYDFCNREPEEDVPIPSNLSANWDYIKKFMIKMTQPCHEMLVYCRWHGDPLPCDEIFNPNLTDEGMCCVFNLLKREFIFRNPKDVSDLNITFPGEVYDWTPEKNYPEGMSFETIPRRARGSGTHLGLTIVADAEIHQYFCSSGNSQGFKVFLSNPLETPKLKSYAVPLAAGYESKVIITPRQTSSTNELKGIAIDKRNCFFESEKHLFFYKTYNQRSCILECEANYTIALCGCVQYYMPKNETTRICGRNDAKCANRAQKKLEISINDAFQNLSVTTSIEMPSCNCLPGCFEMSYGFQLSSSPITTAFPVDPDMLGEKSMEYFAENMGIFHFYYMEKQFSGTVKGVIFGFTEFLSNTGGLLGLFMGFSFLSGVEIVYFVIMKTSLYVYERYGKKDSNLTEKTVEEISANSDFNVDFHNEIGNKILANPYPFMK